MKRSIFLGAVFASVATILVGGSVAVSGLLTHYPPLWSQSIRYALGAGILALVAISRGLPFPRLSVRELLLLLALALTGLVGFNLCLLAALRYSDPTAVGTMVGAVPIFLALVGPLTQRQIPQLAVVLGAGIISVGTIITQGYGNSATTPLGILLSIGALLGEASFTLLAVPLLPKLGPLVLSFYACAMASVILAVLALFWGGDNALPVPTLLQFLALGYLALAVTAGAFLAWYAGLTRLGAARAGLFSSLIPISTLVCGIFLGTTSMTFVRALGCGLVAVGVVIGFLPSLEKRTRKLPLAQD
ncbi:MAG TPA: DMT family transporter [Ktedonobacteraceae bacterium]|nr:DMT family transporter [Ktedonobacteraceae bacterium]